MSMPASAGVAEGDRGLRSMSDDVARDQVQELLAWLVAEGRLKARDLEDAARHYEALSAAVFDDWQKVRALCIGELARGLALGLTKQAPALRVVGGSAADGAEVAGDRSMPHSPPRSR